LVNTAFIIANTPPEHRIYFVVGSYEAYEHENMRKTLKSFGESFEERVEKRGELAMGFFRRRKVQRLARFVFGSTSNKAVIRSIFDSYISWEMGSPFIFLVARREPPKWKDVVSILSAGRPYPSDFVLNSHCLMRTVVDDGMFIASIEITREQIIEIASRIAKELSMELTVRTLPYERLPTARHS